MATIQFSPWAKMLYEQAQKHMEEHYAEMDYVQKHGQHSSKRMRRRFQDDYERGFCDGATLILVNLAQRCRLAAQLRRRAAGTPQSSEAHAAWAEAWNAFQVAKRIYNENQ